MPPADGSSRRPSELQLQTDAVIESFGLPDGAASLSSIAAEMERRLHIFPGGPGAAVRIVQELRRRAVAMAGRAGGR
jgi:hypothetical protein